MAEINKTDIAEEKVLSNLIPTAEDLKAIHSLDEALKSIAKTSKEKIKVENTKNLAQIREEEKAQIALEKVAREKIKTDRERIRMDEQIRKLSERKAKAMKDEESAYKRTSKTLNELRNRYRDLAVEGKANTVEAREMLKTIQRLDDGLKKVDATVGVHNRTVGNYQNALKGATNVLRQFGMALGAVAIARDAVGVIRDFEQANATLSAVLGVSTEQTKALQEQQKGLGETTSFTASQVAELQTELAKLGFTEKELIASTEGVLLLAKAAGTDLANAAAIAGSTLRGFGLEAEEMGRVSDVMAKSFSTSALDIEKFKESMKTVAPIAKSAGVSLEETTAMLGALANAGISGSNAGTALRRILSEVATTGQPVAEAMKEMAERGMDLSDASDEVGKNAMSALLVLNESNEDISRLAETYRDANGSAKEMADTMDNTLNGALARLRSAWEGQILRLNDTTKGASGLTKAINFLSRNLDKILKVITVIGSAWLSWKATIIATRVATTAYTSTISLMAIATGKSATAIKGADTAMKSFNATTRANPLGLLVTLIGTAITAWYAFAESADMATRAQERLNDQIEKGTQSGKLKGDVYQESLSKVTDAIQEQANQMILAGKSEEEVNNFLINEKKKQTQLTINLIDEEIKKERKAVEERAKIRDEEIRRLNSYQEFRGKRVYGNEQKQIRRTLEEQRDVDKKRTESYIAQLELRLNELKSNLSTTLVEEKKHEDELTKSQVKSIQDRQKELDLLRRRAEDMEDARIIDEWKRKEQQLWRAFGREMEAIKGQSEVERRLRLELQKKLDADLLELEKERYRKQQAEAVKFADWWEDFINNLDKTEQDLRDAEMNAELKVLEKHSKEKELLLLQSTGEILEKNGQLTEQQQKDLAEKEKQILIELLEDKIALHKAYGKDTLDLEIQLQKAKNDLNQNELKSEKDLAESLKAVADSLNDYWEKRFDERLSMIDREMEAAQKQADFYRDLAAQGNIDAQQSILEQQKIIEQAQREREKVEREKARLQLVNSGLSTYQQKIANGDKSPLLSTITEVTALTKFLQTLPAFFDGTENTGSGGGVDGKGGFPAILHPNERVMPKKDNIKTTGLSNSLLADIGYKYRTGQLIDVNQNQDIAGTSFDLIPLMKKQDELINAVKNITQIDYNLENVVSNAFTLVKRENKGKEVVSTKTKLRR